MYGASRRSGGLRVIAYVCYGGVERYRECISVTPSAGKTMQSRDQTILASRGEMLVRGSLCAWSIENHVRVSVECGVNVV